MGIVKTAKKPYLNPSSWINKMKDVPVFLLGNAPSIEDENLSILNDYFTIGTNRIFFVYDPTILLWQDLALWIQEKKRVMETRAIKFVRESADTEGGYYGFKLEGKDARTPQSPNTLYGRGSSGSLLFQLAFVLGCNPIFLVGMDCKYRDGKSKTDFYGNNPMHKPHTLINCTKALKFIESNQNVRTIINCSDSAVFKERTSLSDAVKMCGEKKYTREILESMLLS